MTLRRRGNFSIRLALCFTTILTSTLHHNLFACGNPVYEVPHSDVDLSSLRDSNPPTSDLIGSADLQGFDPTNDAQNEGADDADYMSFLNSLILPSNDENIPQQPDANSPLQKRYGEAVATHRLAQINGYRLYQQKQRMLMRMLHNDIRGGNQYPPSPVAVKRNSDQTLTHMYAQLQQYRLWQRKNKYLRDRYNSYKMRRSSENESHLLNLPFEFESTH